MQGIPGGGKTHLAEQIVHATNAFYCSTDEFRFTDDVYVYDPETNKKFHSMCQEACLIAMVRGDETIVVDNTFIMRWQAAVYVVMAKEFGYEVQIVRVQCDIETAIKRQLLRSEDRRVPEYVIRDFAARMEDLSPLLAR